VKAASNDLTTHERAFLFEAGQDTAHCYISITTNVLVLALAFR
jgi:hypothetical protein